MRCIKCGSEMEEIIFDEKRPWKDEYYKCKCGVEVSMATLKGEL